MSPKSATHPFGDIVQEGHPTLRGIAAPVTKDEFGTPKLQSIIDKMKAELDSQDDGVAIAAPQIDVAKRIFLISKRAFRHQRLIKAREKTGDKDKDAIVAMTEKPDADLVCINPTIIKTSKEQRWSAEGCLSVRYKYGKALRHTKATIKAQDINGNWYTLGASGLLAQIFQHECDHLEGILFTDHAKDVEDIPPEDMK